MKGFTKEQIAAKLEAHFAEDDTRMIDDLELAKGDVIPAMLANERIWHEARSAVDIAALVINRKKFTKRQRDQLSRVFILTMAMGVVIGAELRVSEELERLAQ